MASDKALAFLARNAEAAAVLTVTALAVIGVICLAAGAPIAGGIFLVLAVSLAGLGTWLFLSYRAWEREVEKANSVQPTDGEAMVELTHEQFEAVLRDGFVVLPDGSHVVSDRFKKSGKMKHIRAEDHESLNGPIITEKNKDYDGPRISDFEEKYGKHFGKRTEK